MFVCNSVFLNIQCLIGIIRHVKAKGDLVEDHLSLVSISLFGFFPGMFLPEPEAERSITWGQEILRTDRDPETAYVCLS